MKMLPVLLGLYSAQAGYSGFQVMGRMKDFLGLEILDSGIFLGRKIWQVCVFGWLDLSRDFLGYSKQSEDLW